MAFPVVRNVDGGLITPGSLPPDSTRRWTPGRRATILLAVRGGLLTIADVDQRWRISPDEFAEWDRRFDGRSAKSLRVTSRAA